MIYLLLCGFAGHSAVHGCSKCLKEFQFQTGLLDNKLDSLDAIKTHGNSELMMIIKIHSQQYLKASTKAMRKSVVSQCGVQYSLLIKLPYFNIIRMHVIDPMLTRYV